MRCLVFFTRSLLFCLLLFTAAGSSLGFANEYEIHGNAFKANLNGILQGWGGMGDVGTISSDGVGTRYFHWEGSLDWTRRWLAEGKVSRDVMDWMLGHHGNMAVGGGFYVSYNALDSDSFGGQLFTLEPKQPLKKLVLTNPAIVNAKNMDWTRFNQLLQRAGIDVVEYRAMKGQAWAKLISDVAIQEIRAGSIEDVYSSNSIKNLRDLLEADQRLGVKDHPWLRERYPLIAKALAEEPLSKDEMKALVEQIRSQYLHGFLGDKIKRATLAVRLADFKKFSGLSFEIQGANVSSPKNFESYLYQGLGNGFELQDLVPEVRPPRVSIQITLQESAWKTRMLNRSGQEPFKNLLTGLQFLPFDDAMKAMLEGNPEPWTIWDKPGEESWISRWSAASKIRSAYPETPESLRSRLQAVHAKLVPGNEGYRTGPLVLPEYRVDEKTKKVLEGNPWLSVRSRLASGSSANDAFYLVEVEFPSAKSFRRLESGLPGKLPGGLRDELIAAEGAGRLADPALNQRVMEALVDHVLQLPDSTPAQRYQMLNWISPFEKYNQPVLKMALNPETFFRDPHAELNLTYPEFYLEELSGRAQLGELVHELDKATAPTWVGTRPGPGRITKLSEVLNEPAFWRIARQNSKATGPCVSKLLEHLK